MWSLDVELAYWFYHTMTEELGLPTVNMFTPDIAIIKPVHMYKDIGAILRLLACIKRKVVFYAI